MVDLRITVDGRELQASWVDDNPETRRALRDALPVEGEAARWGDELYFDVPVDESPVETREAVPEGAVAYWPAGNALCLFWGPTPASRDDEPRAAGPVAVLAEIADISPLADLDGNGTVRVEEA
ncbi:hypothetical protein BRC81_14220 [Halobacteriales archaeon QS_1_68_20]|nr:MAG: hypothetical protein BRC81_14220 [Halobacteriales archaeon QS_1_68_20]